jgi:hypothetical protein
VDVLLISVSTPARDRHGGVMIEEQTASAALLYFLSKSDQSALQTRCRLSSYLHSPPPSPYPNPKAGHRETRARLPSVVTVHLSQQTVNLIPENDPVCGPTVRQSWDRRYLDKPAAVSCLCFQHPGSRRRCMTATITTLLGSSLKRIPNGNVLVRQRRTSSSKRLARSLEHSLGSTKANCSAVHLRAAMAGFLLPLG